MSDVTRVLSQIEDGDPSAAEQLLPLVYDELRRLAAARLAHEKPGQTLQATALVHDAFLRLVEPQKSLRWDSRGHFFAAAAESMRRILVENARRKQRVKRGGRMQRQELDEVPVADLEFREDLIELDAALEALATVDPQAAQLTKLRYFAGLPMGEIAELLGISPRAADRVWAFSRAWLRREIEG